MTLKAVVPLPRRTRSSVPEVSPSEVPELPIVAADRPNRGSFTFDDLCAAWIEGFQAQFVLAFRDGYAAGDRVRRPAAEDHSLPDLQVVTARVGHVLGLPLALAHEDRHARAVLSKCHWDGEREGQRIGYALGWRAIQGELGAAQKRSRAWDRGRAGSDADPRALGDGTAGSVARRMMLPARLACSLGVTWKLAPGTGDG